MGRQSIEHYRSLSRTPVFSHDELLCKMVAQPDKLELCLLPMASEDAAKMASLEEQLRLELRKKVRKGAHLHGWNRRNDSQTTYMYMCAYMYMFENGCIGQVVLCCFVFLLCSVPLPCLSKHLME